MNTFFIVLIAVLSLFLIEQIFCFFLGSYPYRYGIRIKKINLPLAGIGFWESGREKCYGLKIKINNEKNEAYCRYRYRYGTNGPFIFIGQAKLYSPSTVLIRMGPCTGFSLVAFVLLSFFRAIQGEWYYSFLNLIAVAGAVLFFYLQIVNSIQQCKKIIMKS